MPRKGYTNLTIHDETYTPLHTFAKKENRSDSNAAETLLLEILTAKGYIKEGRKN